MKGTGLFFFMFFLSVFAYSQCDGTKRPIVFVHGFLASGDSYAKQIQRFVDAGYCTDRLFVFDWNSISGNAKRTDSLLNEFIDSVLKKTGAAQIDLVGHSAGGGLGRGYLTDSVQSTRIAHYIHLGSGKWFKDLSWYPNSRCLNIYSGADKIMGSRGGNIGGANNIELKDKDHYEVATSMETFRAIYAFINNGKDIRLPELKPWEEVYIGGRAVYLGENTPMNKATVNIYAVDEKNGHREPRKGTATYFIDEKGNWGPFLIRTNQHYEIELVPADEKERKISYYFEPFKKEDRHIYLRGLPQGNMISVMLGAIPSRDDQSVLVVYSSQKAMIAGRDSVTVNGLPVSSEELTPASKTVISSFIYEDGDGISSGKMIKQLKMAPFIGGVDISLPVLSKEVNTVYYNGRVLYLPSVASKQKILLAVFN
jgi:hypothetical protein